MRRLLCFTVVIIFLSCSNSTNSSDTNQRSTTLCALPDSLFPFKNISNTLMAEHLYYDIDNSGYTDSTKESKLILLNETQKQQLIDSIPPYSRDWIMGDWQIYFVSKQSNIGALAPIIVSGGGTDFSGLILILLDSTCHPVSSFILSGGECGVDPIECDFKQSFLNGNRINSYVRSIVDKDNLYNADSLLIDSVNYVTEILPDGRFETKRADSIRYKGKPFIR